VLLLVGPVASVFMVALSVGAWFNAVSFAVLAIILAISVADLDQAWRVRRSSWTYVLGIALVAFGSGYPHFVEGPWYRVLYAAPAGVVPCPTLAVVAGFTVLTGAHGSRTVPVALAVWTAFYALFGVFVLGVVVDIGLIAGVIGLVAVAAHNILHPVDEPSAPALGRAPRRHA
jgi:hypothetical protein